MYNHASLARYPDNVCQKEWGLTRIFLKVVVLLKQTEEQLWIQEETGIGTVCYLGWGLGGFISAARQYCWYFGTVGLNTNTFWCGLQNQPGDRTDDYQQTMKIFQKLS